LSIQGNDFLVQSAELVKVYGGRKVVDGVSINVSRGEIVGLLGPNGAGKTTTFYMITGLVKPDAGFVYLDGNNVTKIPMYQRARLGMGYLAQEPSIFRRLTVEQNIRAVLQTVQEKKPSRCPVENAGAWKSPVPSSLAHRSFYSMNPSPGLTQNRYRTFKTFYAL